MVQSSEAFDIKRAMADPSAYFAQPADVLARRGLSRRTKLKLLQHWEHDARSLAVAEGEGMSGGEESMHGRVLDALRTLDAAGASASGAAPATAAAPTARDVLNAVIEGTRTHPVVGLLVSGFAGYALGMMRSRR